ncbi:MAG: plastocyanin/azurin family copper-binding protein [Vicinamibacteria bacterium]
MLNARTGSLAALAAGLILASCGGGGGGSSYSSNPTPMVTPTPSATAADVVITITGISGGMSFSPSPASVKAGQTVAWRNNGGTTHTATQDGGGGFDTGPISDGATSAPIKMSTAGTLSYHCAIHPSMVGSVSVGSATGGGY